MISNKNERLSNIQLTQEEKYALSYLQERNSTWAEQFQALLLISRDKITQRLITSLHRENLVNSRELSQITSTNDESSHSQIETNRPELLEIQFPKSSKVLLAPIKGRHAFDRIEVEGPFYFKSMEDGTIQRITHPELLLTCILNEAPELRNEASQQFSDDMMNSVANMAIALSFQSLQLGDAQQSLWEIIHKAEDSYLRSEQAVIEGHPLHPGAKLRKGMRPKEAIHYSSEFGEPIAMKFVLLHNNIARTQTINSTYDRLAYDMFPGLHEAALKKVNPDELSHYHIMIIHPWQYDAVLERDYAKELSQELIIPIDYHTDYFAGLSFRTLMPKYPDRFPHIKLSTNVHITGEIRTLSEQTTYNGPLVTKYINNIMTTDPLFRGIQSSPIDEIAGIHFYNSQDDTTIQTDRSEQLGTLYRTNIYDLLEENVTPMITSSLVANHRFNEEMPITSLIQLYASHHGALPYASAAKAWFKVYSQALLDMVIPLFVKYGIALEAHLQNTIAAFNQDGSLNRIYIRDFEGLRIDEAYLNGMGYPTSHFHEKSRILTDQPVSVFNKAFYSTVQNHLGELVLNAVNASASETLEDELWEIISKILEEKMEELKATVDEERVKSIGEALFAPSIDYKCVTTMRLQDEAHHYTYIKVNNPLHRK